jgi:hypothetical protein
VLWCYARVEKVASSHPNKVQRGRGRRNVERTQLEIGQNEKGFLELTLH